MEDDEAAWRLTDLWVAHKPAVEAYLRRRMRSDAVDDCVQATFMVAWQRLDTVPDDSGALPWLLAVARRVMLTRWRDDGRQQALFDAAAQTLRDQAVSAERRGVDRVALARAWGQLDDDDREALALVAWDGLTGQQAGQVLGISRGAFVVRLMRARRRLARLLADDVVVDVVGRGGGVRGGADRIGAARSGAVGAGAVMAGVSRVGELCGVGAPVHAVPAGDVASGDLSVGAMSAQAVWPEAVAAGVVSDSDMPEAAPASTLPVVVLGRPRRKRRVVVGSASARVASTATPGITGAAA